MKAACLVLPVLAAPALAFSPVLSTVEPRGGQLSTEREVTFSGERLDGACEVVFYEPGLAARSIAVENGQKAVVRLAIAADARLGEHVLRLRTPGGLSELRSFWVGAFPCVAEVEPNATFGSAQRVELNRTVEGVAGNEDDDFYVVSLKKGQRLSAEVEAMRLGGVFFDASVAILDPRNFELASCDDTPLLRNDPCASIIAPEDGDYRVQVREAAYEGSAACQYRLHLGTFPRPTAVFPSGGRPGESVEFTFLGDPSGPFRRTLRLPDVADGRHPLFPEQDGLSAPSPLWITVSPLECVRESGSNADPASATPMPPPPSAAHGILDGSAPEDWFRFDAHKGRNLQLKVIARSHRSPLDPVLSVHQADGRQLAANDDQGGPDSLINWTCPQDGPYFLRLRDQLSRTGADFTYRIEVLEKTPALSASLPTVERVNSQKWKTFPVPRGNRHAAVVNLTRENLACEAVFRAESLPAGVVLHGAPAARGVNSFPVVFEAAADAPLAGGLHRFFVDSAGDAPRVSGPLVDTIHLVDVNNEGAYHSVALDRIAMAVTEPAPFRIDLEPPSVPLVRNGTLPLKLKVTREPGYAEKITARFLWSPPGVSGPVSIELAGDRTEGDYELNAAADAAAGTWQVCVQAEAGTPRGPVLVSSALVPLRVEEPYLAMTLDLAATEQGRAVVMPAKVEIARPFEGQAAVELLGLPHGVTCPPRFIDRNSTALEFPLAVAADATVGKHTGVFCRVGVPGHGGAILHQTASGGTLRIDAPPAAASAGAEAPAAPPAPAGAKPLSRLEQLRQKAR